MIKTRLVRLLSHAKKYIFYNVLWQWFALLLQISVIFTITRLIGRAFAGSLSNMVLGKSVLFLLVALAARFLCDKMASKASYQASVDVKRILREKIYEKLLRLGASYQEVISTSEIVQMSGEGVEQLEIYFGKYLPQLFYSLLAPVTLFIVLCRISVKASVVLLICVPLIPLSIVAVQKIAGKLFRKYWGYYSNLGDIFLENLQGLTTLKIYQADEEKAVQMDDAAQKFRKITMKVLTMQLNSTSVMDIVAYGGAAVGMAVAAGEYFAGNITLSGTMMIVLLASEFFIPLRLLGSFFHISMNGMSASDKIFRLLDTEEPEKGNLDFSENEKNTEKNNLSISLNHVDFSYEENRQILHGIDLLIPAGSFISLVGESGCGKSTIAGIISGKNRGYKGDISIGNIPLSKIKEEELLSHITRVCHNSYLFKGTVEENLRMAKEDASAEEMIAVLKKVNLWNFLSAENGLRTQILEKGSNFSGGQCQRLELARALLHDTPIYIFDEATSNIDAESEEMIMNVIKELDGTKTIILISHRLSNVVESDCIYMLENGQIAERGTHEVLMHNKNAYYRLYTAQQELEQYGKEKQAVEQKENNKKSSIEDNNKNKKNNEENTIDRSSNIENEEGRKKTWKQVV